MEAMPLVEQYMKLRASGHHISEEEEEMVVQAMLERAAQVDQFESQGLLFPLVIECFPSDSCGL
jgi:hypothetical protein